MFVICNGMPRSASTWSFRVVVELLERQCPGELIHKGYSQNPVQFTKAAPAGVRHVVMKSHPLTPLGRNLLRVGAVKVIYTWRDLADAVVSGLETFARGGATFDIFLESFDEALEVLAFHRREGMALEVGYADVMADARGQVERIARHLWPQGAPAKTVDEVCAATSMDAAERRVAEVNGVADEQLVLGLHSRFDPGTLFHRHHLNGGEQGKGRARLSAEQLEALERLREKHGFRDLTLA
ncbi:MAG: hypothetical protein U0R19_21450 [Bryobacteraceae bacterium]